MEKFVNELITKLNTKIGDKDLITVQNAVYSLLNDYEITQKSTELLSYDGFIPDEVKVYLVARKVEGLSEKSLKQYYRTLERFFSDVKKPCQMVTTQDLRAHFYKLQTAGTMQARSLETQRVYLSGFFRWLVDNEYISKNPMTPIKPFKYERKVFNELSEIELEKIRDLCVDAMDKAIIDVLYSTGCRVSELVNIKLSDMDLEKKEVQINHGKGNKSRIVFLNARAIVSINEMLSTRNYETVYLFEASKKPHNQLSSRSIEKRVQKLQDASGIRIYPHKVRRTTATHALKKGMPIEEVQKLLGHDFITTTLIYTNISTDKIKYDHEKYLS